MQQERIRCGISSAKANLPFRAGRLAAENALRQTLRTKPALCLAFFSEKYATPELVEGIIRSAPAEVVAGCSTNGEIAAGYWRESVSTIVLSSKHIRFGFAVENNSNLANPSADTYKKFYENALYDLREKIILQDSALNLSTNIDALEPDFGMLFLPSIDLEMGPKSNEVIKGLRSYLGNLPLIGGTVGDDNKYETGYVIYKDEFLENHTLLILAYSDLKFSMAQRHGYKIKKEFTAEKVYGNNLVTLNGQNASEAYFDSLKIPVVEISDYQDEICALNPLGVYDETTNELQILFPMSRGKGATEINLSQTITKGQKIFLMEANIEESRQVSLESIKAAFASSTIKDPSVGLMFSCVGRSTFYFNRALDEIDEIKNRFKYTKIAGAYLYGTLCGANNWVSEGTTSTLLLGNDLREERIREKKEKVQD